MTSHRWGMMKKHRKQLSGVEKAIILLTILGRDISKKILPFLNAKEKTDLLSAKSKKSHFSRSDEKKVLLEYKRHMKQDFRESNLSKLELVYVFVILLLVTAVFELFGFVSRENTAFKNFIDVGGSYVAIFPIIVFIIYGFSRVNIVTFSLRSDNRIKDIALGLAAGVILFCIMAGSAIVSGEKLSPVKEKGIYLIVLLFVAGYVGPVLEEFFFRRVIHGFLKEKFNLFIGITLSSLLFALLHIPESVISLPFYFAAGCVLVWLYEYSRKLFAPLLAHSMSNILILFY